VLAGSVLDAGDEQLVRLLAERADGQGISLAGEGGLLAQLTKLVLEAGLEAEMTSHLGYDKHDPTGRDRGNSRNGVRAKTMITEVGPVQIEVPRDRDASFEPVTVPKRVRRLRGVDEMVISLVARGMSTGDVQAHLAEVYGTNVSRQQISTITDAVVDKMAEWASRPLDAVYPVVGVVKSFGCGSPEGTSGGLRDDVVGVAGSVDASLFLAEVVAPVGVEVVVAA
jgi:putative transposase